MTDLPLILGVLIAIATLAYLVIGRINDARRTRHVLEEFLRRQSDFSNRAFGAGPRTEGILDHIRKELMEIEAAPRDLMEWIDVATLALDGAMRAGHSPRAVAEALWHKQRINIGRKWSKPAGSAGAIEHDRSKEKKAA